MKRIIIISVLITIAYITGYPQISFEKGAQKLGSKAGKCAASGDIDNDGDIDIVIGYFGDNANAIWINEGDTSFVLSDVNIGTGGCEVALADINNDSHLDIVFSNAGAGWAKQANTAWINQGDGTFNLLDQTLGGETTGPEIIQIVDFNKDTYPDIVIDNSIWINDGNAAFSKSESKVDGVNIANFTLGDLDSDGDLDAFAAGFEFENGAPSLVFLNEDTAFIQDAIQSIGKSQSQFILLGDLNGDNNLDAFIPNFHSSTSSGESDEVWMNDGSGIFTKGDFSTKAKPTYDAKLVDIDKDGDLDIYTAYSSYSTGMNNYVWINNGTGEFTGLKTNIYSSHDVEINDFNGDGLLDVLALFATGNQLWFQEKQIGNLLLDRSLKFSIFPNPTKGIINIETNSIITPNDAYQLIDMRGKIVQQGQIVSEIIDMTDMQKGIYILNLKSAEGFLTQKIMIE